jgi:acetoacetyl-CoA synthetase
VSVDVAPSLRDEVRQAVRSGFTTLLGVDNPGDDDDFFDLGGDSLVALSLLLHVEEAVGLTLPITAIYDATTIARLTDRLIAGGTGRDTTLVELRPARGRTPGAPLFLLHGLGGSVMVLRDLARQIGGNRAVWGIEAVGLDGACAPLDDVQAMAQDAVQRIRKVAPHGPYLLAGYSFGGLVALEIARLLDAQGEKIGLLAMLDTFPHPSTWKRSVRIRAFFKQIDIYFSYKVWYRLAKREFAKLRGRSPLAVAARLCRGAVRAVTLPTDIMGTAWVYDLADRAPRPAELLMPLDRNAVPAANYETIEAVTSAARRAFETYTPLPYRGHLLVVHATLEQVVPFTPRALWGHLAGSLSVIDVQTDHQALVRGQAKVTAAHLTRAIEAGTGVSPG